MPPTACTIVSNNYLAQARVFARSFRTHHPDGRVWVLIVDEPHPSIDYEAEPFRTLFAAELGIPAFRSFAFRYSILELNTAVKPYLLAELGQRAGLEGLCYFDPDVLVLAPLDALYDELRGASLLLTPHVTAPLPDERRPSERDLLQAGVYNLGFLGLSFRPDTAEFLRWWQEKLYLECRHRVEEGLFVDQRWMDLAPCLLEDVRILRHPGCNVAYWNLPHRRLRRDSRGWRVGGEPLYFFHFSGFDPDQPDRISRFQDRYTLADRPDVAPLFRDYRERLLEAGLEATRRLDYAWGRFEGGVAVPPCAREALRRLDPEGERWPDPFAAGEDSFLAWLAAPWGGGGDLALPRIAHALWEQRPDLRRQFPTLAGEQAVAFGRWLLERGARQADLEATLLEPVRARLVADGPSPGTGGGRESASPDAGRAPADLLRPGAAAALGAADRQWLAADADLEPGRPRIPRLALELHRGRADLRTAFPEPLGASRRGLARWYATYGRREYRLQRELVSPTVRTLPPGDRLWVGLWWLLKGR